jgi:DNA polymerase-4
VIPPRAILHADMDAFYASVEQRDRPELRGRPVMVGGTSTRGVVMAASYEARVFGVHSAMPSVQAKKLCPHGVFLRGDMAKYRRVSAEIREVFDSVSPDVEPLSLDEAFIDVTACRRLFGPPLTIGRLLKDRVRAKTGLAVSVGIGPGKMIAKLASDASKPDGLLEVLPGEVRAFLDPLPVGRLWGVGPVTRAVLERAGIRTIADLVRDRAGPAPSRRGAGDRVPPRARPRRGRARRRGRPRRQVVRRGEHVRRRRPRRRAGACRDHRARRSGGAPAAPRWHARAHRRAQDEARGAHRTR